MAAFAQGVTLGALLQGIAVAGRAYAGGWWDWLTPFSLLTGVALVVGYALLGATWLIMKSEGSLQEHCYRMALSLRPRRPSSAWRRSASGRRSSTNDYYQRWFAWPQVLFTAQVPLLVAVAAVGFFSRCATSAATAPFLIALGLFALGLPASASASIPYVVPRAITIWDAAAPANSLGFMLVGAAVLVPIILIYTGYAYWVFRGKTGHEGYH